MKTILRVPSVIVIFVLLISGCARAEEEILPTSAPTMTNTALLSSPTPAPPTQSPTPEDTPTPTATEIPTLTMEELVGIWKEITGYTEFRADGTFYWASDLKKLKSRQYEVTGKFHLSGNQIVIDEDSVCSSPGVYELYKKEGDLLSFKKVKEECSQREMPYLRREPDS